MMVCGYYLAFFFMISHNYEGVFAQKDTTRPSNKGCEENSWLYKQVCPPKSHAHVDFENLLKGVLIFLYIHLCMGQKRPVTHT